MAAFIQHNNSASMRDTLLKTSGQVTTAAAVSLLVFYGMSKLLATDEQSTYIPHQVVDVDLFVPRADKPAEIRHTLPPKPVEVPPPAAPRITNLASGAGDDLPIETITPPPVSVGTDTPAIGAAPSQDATPVVRMEPKYPVDAARNGIQGWVELSFSIDTLGQVQDVTVLNSEPRRVFDQAAIQALKRWKYRPKVVEGKAIMQTGLAVRLDFNLEQQQ